MEKGTFANKGHVVSLTIIMVFVAIATTLVVSLIVGLATGYDIAGYIAGAITATAFIWPVIAQRKERQDLESYYKSLK